MKANQIISTIAVLSSIVVLTGCGPKTNISPDISLQIDNDSDNGNNAEGNSGNVTQIQNSGNDNTFIAGDNITVYVDGAATDLKNEDGENVSPIIYNHEIYFPITAISEEINTPVQYDTKSGAVYIGKNPNDTTNMLDIVPAYDTQNFKEYSFLKSKGVEKFEMAGKQYVDGAVFTAGYNDDHSVAHFGLDGKYKKFSFKINHLDGTEMTDVILRIYIDGFVALEEKIESSDYLKQFEINVENCLQLKIEIAKCDGYEPSYGMVDMELEPV